MGKVAVIFTNDSGEYYLEAVEEFRDFETLKDNWEGITIMDETENMAVFRFTQAELYNPTVDNGKQLAVIEYLG